MTELHDLTPAEAGDAILRAVAEQRLIQREWHREVGGRHLACLLGSMHPDIDSADKCPAHLMPRWLAEYVVVAFDGLAQADIYPLAERFADMLRRGLFSSIPDRVRDLWLADDVIETAVSAAREIDGDAACWPEVEAACHQVQTALRDGGDLKEAAAAAAAARAAARSAAAADAAWVAARSAAAVDAAWVAVDAAAWAARLAAAAAVDAAAWAARLAVAARDAAVARLFRALLDKIEAAS